MTWEREQLEQDLTHLGLTDVQARLKPNANGKEWYSYYGRAALRRQELGWRLDYFMADKTLLDGTTTVRITDIVTAWDQHGSDHVPLLCRIENVGEPESIALTHSDELCRLAKEHDVGHDNVMTNRGTTPKIDGSTGPDGKDGTTEREPDGKCETRTDVKQGEECIRQATDDVVARTVPTSPQN